MIRCLMPHSIIATSNSQEISPSSKNCSMMYHVPLNLLINAAFFSDAGQAPGRSQHKADHGTDCLIAVQGQLTTLTTDHTVLSHHMPTNLFLFCHTCSLDSAHKPLEAGDKRNVFGSKVLPLTDEKMFTKSRLRG